MPTSETVSGLDVRAELNLPSYFDMDFLLRTGGGELTGVVGLKGAGRFAYHADASTEYARGFEYRNSSGAMVGGIGAHGKNGEFSKIYLGIGSSNPFTDSAGLTIRSNSIQWKGSNVVTENSGNATSATKATQDGNGNNIASTYTKQSRFNGRSLALCESSNASGEGSLALGYTTKAIGTTSTALGYFANVSGANAISIGSFTNASGSISVALGDHAAARGIDSVALGEHTEAQYRYASAVGGHAKARAEHSTALGYFANVSGNSSTALGEYAATSNANSIQLGNASRLSSITARVAITVTSDERDKADITEMDSKALDFLKKVKAIRYVFNSRELYIDEENLSDEERKNKEKYGLCAYDREEHAKGTKKGNRIRAGVSAQNVLQALKEVYGDSSYANLVNDNFFDLNKDEIPEGVENQLAVNYEGFIPFLIKAVQELSERLETLESKNGEGTA